VVGLKREQNEGLTERGMASRAAGTLKKSTSKKHRGVFGEVERKKEGDKK